MQLNQDGSRCCYRRVIRERTLREKVEQDWNTCPEKVVLLLALEVINQIVSLQGRGEINKLRCFVTDLKLGELQLVT